MENIIYVRKMKEGYFLKYKDFLCRAFIGKNGLTNNKIEGDLCTPIGRFELGDAVQINEKNIFDKSFNVIKLDENSYFVEESSSGFYNKLVDLKKTVLDFVVDEKRMIDHKELFEYAVEIKINPKNIKQKGSATFLHIKGKNDYTKGCIAIKRSDALVLFKKINKNTIIDIEE